MPKSRVLIVEDDRSLAEILEYNLRKSGYEVTRASDGGDGLAEKAVPHIVAYTAAGGVFAAAFKCRKFLVRKAHIDTPFTVVVLSLHNILFIGSTAVQHSSVPPPTTPEYGRQDAVVRQRDILPLPQTRQSPAAFSMLHTNVMRFRR